MFIVYCLYWSDVKCLMFPSPALLQKSKKAFDWVGVRRRLVQKTNIGRGDTTFLARFSQRRGDARARVARARPSLPRATASRKNERGKRSRDREIAKKQL